MLHVYHLQPTKDAAALAVILVLLLMYARTVSGLRSLMQHAGKFGNGQSHGNSDANLATAAARNWTMEETR